MKNRFSSTASRHARPLAALALLLAALDAQAQTPASFGAVSYYPTGVSSAPTGIAVADVNGDGRPDIVTANIGGNSASVLLGQAGGGFAAFSGYTTGVNSRPSDVAVADVNGDGRPDIVTSNGGNDTVGVLLGQAGGGFAVVSAYSTGINSTPSDVAVADVNGDGRPDIVMSNGGNDTVGVLLGQAGGGFAAISGYTTGVNSRPSNVAVADVNGDGRPDIVTANVNGNSARVLLGQVGGGFAAFSGYSTGARNFPAGLAVADVNGDGRPDIVTANVDGNTASVLLGQAGGFAAFSIYSIAANTNPKGLAVADVNGDGRLDLVTANFNGNSASVLLNTGTFTPLAATAIVAAVYATLFPNPAHNGFAVQLPAAWSAAPARAELLNALGQVVGTCAAPAAGGATLRFATDGLAAGVYVLRVQAGSHTLARRVVVD